MAQSKNNVVTHGLSGKVGGLLVFRQRAGKTIVSKVPKPRTGADSEKQKEQKARFQQAVIYAKSVLEDPVLREIYTNAARHTAGISAYNLAVADFLNPPQILEINISGYKGHVNDIIKITATDDFKLVSVLVIIKKSDGSVLEQGNATLLHGSIWQYKATTDVVISTGDKITVQATDLPDNMTEMTINY